MLYLDTSVLVAAVSREEATPRLLAWLATVSDRNLAIGDWSLTEVASALSGKLRIGTLDETECMAARAGFSLLKSDQLQLLAVERGDYVAATRMVERQGMVLRAPDALHLAVAARNGAEFATLDRHQNAAARAVGLSVAEIG